MSEQRRAALDQLPAIEVPESAMTSITFNRTELTAALGGGLQGVDAKYVQNTRNPSTFQPNNA
jgi:hypothetical protein